MTEYQAPPCEIADFVDQTKRECEEQWARLIDASVDDAWAIATDISESNAARLEAILLLVRNHDSRIPELVLSLFDEADLSVWRSVIRFIHPDDVRLRVKLRQFATSHDDTRIAAEALCVLARMRDESTVSICREWFSREQGPRNAAVEALRLLGSDAAVQLLKDRWSDPVLTDEDRNTLALALAHFQHTDATNLVRNLALAATCSWSVAAATTPVLN